jgi:hypothetical protein
MVPEKANLFVVVSDSGIKKRPSTINPPLYYEQQGPPPVK